MAAMIAAVDDGVGRVVDTLRRHDILDDTIIIFSSDNGPSAEIRNWLDGTEEPWHAGTTGGFRGYKGSLFDGGIREPFLISKGNLRDLYWTPAQMLTHHASNGCNLRPGDLMASGTVSGEAPQSRGCLLEITGGGEPLMLPGGETRRFLEDGDEVIFRGYCEREGRARIGLGECRGILAPAVPTIDPEC